MITEAYVVSCDFCKVVRVVFDATRYMPQEALTGLAKQGWTVYEEVAHCDTCPALCHHCGRIAMEDDHKPWCPRG